jgi:hypothetical protein
MIWPNGLAGAVPACYNSDDHGDAGETQRAAGPLLVLRSHSPHLLGMRKRRRKKPVPLPLMMMELALASWETVGHRSLLIARGRCSPAEYSRMVLEKMSAATRSAASLSRSRRGPDWTAVLAPWHLRATANARRLRRK